MELPNTGALPPPASGSSLEVHFRRLLQKCVDRANGKIGGNSSVDWRKDPKFHISVETLQEQLASLAASTTIRVDNEVLASYTESVALLADALVDPDIPLYCMRIPNSKGAQERPPTTSAVDEASSRLKGAAEIEADDDLLPKSLIDGAIDRHLDTHAQLQEGLTDELVGLASQLKERTKAVESAVHKRDELIDSVDEDVTKSAALAAESSKKAKQQHSRSKMGTCMMCLVLLAVGLVFTGMMVFIKFTSIVGYKAPAKLPQEAFGASPPHTTNTTDGHQEL